MIPFPLAYYRPDTPHEATALYRDLQAAGHRPIYYGGGTEILTGSRLNQVDADVLIDLKGIPAMTQVTVDDQAIGFGAGLTLAQTAADDSWPLLTATVDRIADHTSRSKITLGGNLGSMLPYREAALPFLLVDSWADVASGDSIEKRPFQSVFDGQLTLSPGEFLLRLNISKSVVPQCFSSRKMTRFDWIDYPLVTMVAIRDHQHIKIAVTGYGEAPTRLQELDTILSDSHISAQTRARTAVQHLPITAVDDLHGSATYRTFVFENTLGDILKQLEGP